MNRMIRCISLLSLTIALALPGLAQVPTPPVAPPANAPGVPAPPVAPPTPKAKKAKAKKEKKSKKQEGTTKSATDKEKPTDAANATPGATVTPTTTTPSAATTVATPSRVAQPAAAGTTATAVKTPKTREAKSGKGRTKSDKPAVIVRSTPLPGDVWVNTDTGIYHGAKSKWYGKTKEGTYMSESEAKSRGYRVSKSKTE
jgi:hypothetical protein